MLVHVGRVVIERTEDLRDLVRVSLTDRLGGEEEGITLLRDTVGNGSSSHDGRLRGMKRLLERKEGGI